MAFNLVDSVKSLFGSDLISKASSMLGEDESKVKNAMGGIIPSILTGILNKASSGDAAGVLSMAKETANSGMLSNIGSFFGNNNLLSKGSDMLKGLFGDRMSDVANSIANYFGLKSTSVASLMSVAAPAALGSLGKQAEATNMNPNGMLSFLNGQKDGILNAVPSGLNLAGALGLGSLSSIGTKLSNALSNVTGAVKEIPRAVGKTASGNRWLVPVIIAVLIVALLWYLFSGKKKGDEESQVASPPPIDTAVATPPPAAVVAPMMESIKVKLPNGVELDAYKGGIEDQLVAFLNDPSKKVDKNIWFDFDNLNFETGSATITQESMKQVQNIAMIMKAFPDAAIKIGGYTDKTGDEAANLKLSKERAVAVANAIKDDGIPASRLAGAEGYGSQFAKAAPDAPDEERKKDRRISVSVRKK
jgi:outer membrane protein OmpA-like peptidoglycan-associated protein